MPENTVRANGGVKTRDRAIESGDVGYYRRLGLKGAQRRKETTSLDRRREIGHIGGRIFGLRKLYKERIDRGEMTLDEADFKLLDQYNLMMTPTRSAVERNARRAELGLAPVRKSYGSPKRSE